VGIQNYEISGIKGLKRKILMLASANSLQNQIHFSSGVMELQNQNILLPDFR
jgi:hypothetical protein